MALSDGHLVAPLRNEVSIPAAGFLLAMPAWQPGANITVKMVSVFHENHRVGLPGHQALICLYDAATGSPVAIMDGAMPTTLPTRDFRAFIDQEGNEIVIADERRAMQSGVILGALGVDLGPVVQAELDRIHPAVRYVAAEIRRPAGRPAVRSPPHQRWSADHAPSRR